MPVIDVPLSNLDNESDLLDWLKTELSTNHRFVIKQDTGTVGANNKEIWLERPASETFDSNKPMTLGMKKNVIGVGSSSSLDFAMSYEDYATASAAGTRTWAQFTGTFSNGTGNSSVGVDNAYSVTIGGAYQRARLITSPTSTSATPSEELYFYLILEATPEVYRQVGFGEVVKLVPFNGGVFLFGSQWALGQKFDSGSHGLFGAGSGLASQSPGTTDGIIAGGIWTDHWPSGALTFAGGNGWKMAGPFLYGLAWLDPRGAMSPIMFQTPSPFSLQSERYPATYFGNLSSFASNNASYAGHAQMAQLPDVFLADITSVDAYGVFQDSLGDKYMVVPHYKKSGAGINSSEGQGMLIRNPALTVTI